jgi:hypothetical protein
MAKKSASQKWLADCGLIRFKETPDGWRSGTEEEEIHLTVRLDANGQRIAQPVESDGKSIRAKLKAFGFPNDFGKLESRYSMLFFTDFAHKDTQHVAHMWIFDFHLCWKFLTAWRIDCAMPSGFVHATKTSTAFPFTY